ncbi:hypothetical protein QE390_000541 [Siphonobacter sp. SORGH_AS 1065]|nr:hypothetical protein [Siphonobacter sp. SORGH_AS_1065]
MEIKSLKLNAFGHFCYTNEMKGFCIAFLDALQAVYE